MAFDTAIPATETQIERAAFTRWLAPNVNQIVGLRGSPYLCPLALFTGRPQGPALYPHGAWQRLFIVNVDRGRRNPTGFDCLCILQSIPA